MWELQLACKEKSDHPPAANLLEKDKKPGILVKIRICILSIFRNAKSSCLVTGKGRLVL